MSENPYATPAPAAEMQQSPSSWLKTFLKIGFYGGITVILIGLCLPSINRGREPARRTQCKNNLKQIALALYNYHDFYEAFPPAYTVNENGQQLHSWRTLILPWMEERLLYQKIDLSKPWNHPSNAEAFKTTPDLYRCPSFELPADSTTYLAVVG